MPLSGFLPHSDPLSCLCCYRYKDLSEFAQRADIRRVLVSAPTLPCPLLYPYSPKFLSPHALPYASEWIHTAFGPIVLPKRCGLSLTSSPRSRGWTKKISGGGVFPEVRCPAPGLLHQPYNSFLTLKTLFCLSPILCRILRRKTWNSREFFPERPLKDIIYIDTVLATLNSKGFHLPRTVYNKACHIMHHYIKVFAILVLVDKPEEIEAFFEEQKYDIRMPFTETPLAKVSPMSEEQFLAWQYEFTAPCFGPNPQHYRISSNTILPFIVNEPIASGAFGNVYKIGLDSEHQDLTAMVGSKSEKYTDDLQQVVYFARKELKSMGPKGEEALKREIGTLQTLNWVCHPNVLALQCSYTLEGVHNLIFPWAETDMQKWFAKDRSEGPENLRQHSAVLMELRELASGLDHLHNYVVHTETYSEECQLELIGYHHDLKPGNILIRNGHFQIADFGLARFKPKPLGSTTLWKGGTETYGAPECRDEECQKDSVGRAADIWSFGCILTETLMYLHGGVVSLNLLRDRRVTVQTLGGIRFEDDSFHQHRELKSSVREVLEQLFPANEVVHLEALRDLCLRILVGDPKQRPTAHNVALQFTIIATRSRFLDIWDLLDGKRTLFAKSRMGPYKLIADLIDLELARYRFLLGYFGISRECQDIQPSNNLVELQYRRLLKWFEDMEYKISWLSPCSEDVASSDSEIDESTREGMFYISQHLDELLDLLPLNDRAMAEDAPERSPGSKEGDNEDFLHTDVMAKLSLKTFSAPRTNPMYEHLTAKAVSRSIALMITQSRHAGRESLLMEKELVDVEPPSTPFRLMSQGTAVDRRGASSHVLVEWKHYDSTWSGSQTEELYKRVEDLAQELLAFGNVPNANFLTCMGYIHIPKAYAFGLVLAYPDMVCRSSASSIQVASLQSLVKRHADLQKQARPSLGGIFELSRKVAQALVVMHFGRNSWFHKSLSSEHVIFFLKTNMDISSPPDISRPYLVGFNLSRPDAENAFSHPPPSLTTEHNIYRHPVYLSELPRFCKEHDYYSLGMVLLEIGLWTPFSAFRDSLAGLDGIDARDAIVRELVPQLAERVGDLYMGVVKFCLNAGATHRDAEDYEDEKIVMKEVLDDTLDYERDI
ncbi:kinase-like protein [Lindgomyces ingoldianus]|uniref:Kinase-like protein n=1 Tax=Lindgomyces ingoldianus TaxID=673940 RepID=A0ACB6QP19_9PLEO|nr:kinase-like protein [Lindgomyces ingoldianus]KAF2468617.1 kinase-like protein [Lindgomyces ingoldianus]